MTEPEIEASQAASQATAVKIIVSSPGTYRVESPDGEFVTSSIEELVGVIRQVLQSLEPRVASSEATELEEEDDDAGFENDLDYVVNKNAELYRRLAQ
jgi:hypothetical protein